MDSKYFLLYIFSLVKFWVSIDKDVLSTENVDHGNRLCQVCVWYLTAAGAWDREGWWLHCNSLPLTGPFRYLVIISHHQQRYRNHYYHHHQNHHHKHQLDKTIRVARVTTVVCHSAIIILRWRWGRSLILLQRRISGNGDSSSPASWGEARRPTMLLRKRKRLEENIFWEHIIWTICAHQNLMFGWDFEVDMT